MKRMTIAMALILLSVNQSFAKDYDVNVPSMSSKEQLMEDWGLTAHVDPFQYNRIQKKKFAAQKSLAKGASEMKIEKTSSRKSIVQKNVVKSRKVATAGQAQ